MNATGGRRRGQASPGYIPRLLEAQIQRQCADFMRLDGWRPLQTDPCSDRSRGKGFGEEGMADHLFIRYWNDGDPLRPGRGQGRMYTPSAEVLWVEFKRPAGVDGRGRQQRATKATQLQLAWHAAERAAGALTIIAGEDFQPDFDSFVAWYRNSGLLRREGL